MTEPILSTEVGVRDVAPAPGTNGSYKGLRFAILADSAPFEREAIALPSAGKDAATRDTATKDHGAAQQPEAAPVQEDAASAVGAADPLAQSTQIPRPDTGTIHVRDIFKHRDDNRGETIDLVFFKRPDFAIYQSGGKIVVQYADDDALAKEQVAKIAELLPLKDRLQYLVQNMDRPERYHWQIAESLRLGLYGQKDAAKNIMQGAIDDIVATRLRNGRIGYLRLTLMIAMGVVALSILASAALPWIWASGADTNSIQWDLSRLAMAIASGAVGALFSCVAQLRARAVATDGDTASNFVDSVTRIMVGMISAAALVLIVMSNLFAEIDFAGAKLSSDTLNWHMVLVIGLLAGFVERLVPDLLEKKLAPIANRTST
jgi:hypothetical protein